MMECIVHPSDMLAWAGRRRGNDGSVALVPTMGYFHEGHLSLMRHGLELADDVVVSLFVNPVQFGPEEDFEQYPRDMNRDMEMAEKQGVSVLFAPDSIEMYPPGFQTHVHVNKLSTGLCGSTRPGHFSGVATVIAKLFNLIAPDFAVFGEKDFQQLAVIRQMTRDLDWSVEIIGHPVVRENDGLAMSSRNVYLNPDERKTACCLHQAILVARESVAGGVLDAGKVRRDVESFLSGHENVEIDYVRVVDSTTLDEQGLVNADSRLLLAVRVGSRVRLIDNSALIDT